MYCKWSGSTTTLFCENGQTFRSFTTNAPVQCAQVSGDRNEAQVSITTVEGETWVFRGNGQLLRRA